MATNRSWSIDDKRLNFQFGTEIAWEVKNGKLGRMLKNPTYTGIGPVFWGSLDRLAGDGVVFDDAHAQASQTFNSTSTLFTSRLFPYLGEPPGFPAGIGFDAKVTQIARSYQLPIGDLVYLVAIFRGML